MSAVIEARRRRMRELMADWCRAHALLSSSEIVFLTRAGGGEPLLGEAARDGLVEAAADLAIDREAIAAAVERQLEAARRGEWIDPVGETIRARLKRAEAQLGRWKASLEKTEAMLQVIVETDTLGEDEIEILADPSVDLTNDQRKALKARWRSQAAERKTNGAIGSSSFWVSRDFHEVFDDVAYYRVYERYGLAEFESVFASVAGELGEAALDGVQSLDPFGRRATPSRKCNRDGPDALALDAL